MFLVLNFVVYIPNQTFCFRIIFGHNFQCLWRPIVLIFFFWWNENAFDSKNCQYRILYSSCIVPHRNWFWFAAVEAINTHEILQVVQLTKFDYRLANDLDEELQKLRCRVNYHALRFTKPIQELGQRLVFRMQQMAKRFIAIHLRFVPVTLSFCELE